MRRTIENANVVLRCNLEPFKLGDANLVLFQSMLSFPNTKQTICEIRQIQRVTFYNVHI